MGNYKKTRPEEDGRPYLHEFDTQEAWDLFTVAIGQGFIAITDWDDMVLVNRKLRFYWGMGAEEWRQFINERAQGSIPPELESERETIVKQLGDLRVLFRSMCQKPWQVDNVLDLLRPEYRKLFTAVDSFLNKCRGDKNTWFSYMDKTSYSNYRAGRRIKSKAVLAYWCKKASIYLRLPGWEKQRAKWEPFEIAFNDQTLKASPLKNIIREIEPGVGALDVAEYTKAIDDFFAYMEQRRKDRENSQKHKQAERARQFIKQIKEQAIKLLDPTSDAVTGSGLSQEDITSLRGELCEVFDRLALVQDWRKS